MERRAQAALEFLTTYGWAILVIMVMIGAISYFGILRPDEVLPSRCTVAAEFTCDDHIVQGNQVRVRLQQGIGKTIYVEDFDCAWEGNLGMAVRMDGAVIADTAWSPTRTAEFSCGSFPQLSALAGEKVKLSFSIKYRQSATGFLHTADGEVYTEVQ